MRSLARSTAPHGAVLASLMCALVIGAGLAAPATGEARTQVRNPEDLLIVDCLLPGQVRKLGRQATFMSARRPVRTTQADCEIRGGEYVAHDRANYQTALKVWMDQALSGSAEAQNYVGEIYHKGLGIAPDYGMAAQWYQKAAAQGYKRAKINLGYLYEQGLGVPQDLSRALNLYREASGITGDELLFASTVQLQMKARDVQIGELQQQVESEKQTSEQLRGQVRELEGQLQSRKSALERSSRELEATQARLAEARQAVGVDLGGLDAMRTELAATRAELDRKSGELRERQEENERRAADVETRLAALREREAALAAQQAANPAEATRKALADIRTQTGDLSAALEDARKRALGLSDQLAQNEALLERQRQRYEQEIARLQAQAEGRKQEDWELMKLLENQLATKESEIRQQQQQITRLERRIVGSGTSGIALAAAVPTLEIIDPPLTATRGRPAAMLRRSPGPQDLVGKVSAPQGVQSIAVNGAAVPLDANGVFRTRIDVAAAGTQVEVTALDRQGAAASLSFMMIPQADGSALATAGGTGARAGELPRGVTMGKFHALVIGNNSYQNAGYPALRSAVEDATAVARVLKERYGYRTTLLLNGTRFEMLSALNTMRESLGEDDNLLLYYAGHGELDDPAGQGYWIPTDAQQGNPDTWISNAAISDILNTMDARHVLVVADSCYAGAMTRSAVPTFDASVMPADQWSKWVSTMAAGRSRTALTSGGVQPVPDTGSGRHSYFARAFLNVLEDNNRLLEAQRLFREVSATLSLAAVDAPVTQTPEYSPIQFAGHETGDFFFLPNAGVRAAGP